MSLELFDPPDFLGLDSDDDLVSAGLLADAGFDSVPELPLAAEPLSFDPDVSFVEDELSLDPDELSLEALSLDAGEFSPDAPAPSPPPLSDFAAGARCAFLP